HMLQYMTIRYYLSDCPTRSVECSSLAVGIRIYKLSSTRVESEYPMSTTSSSPQETQVGESAIVPTTGRTIQGWILILLVIVAGACSLAVELSASRLLAPYFGTSL